MAAFEAFVSWGKAFQQRLDYTWFGIPAWQYIFAFIFVLASLFARRGAEFVLGRIVIPWLEPFGGGYPGRVVEALMRPLTAYLGITGLFFAARTLMLQPDVGPSADPFITVEFVNQMYEIAMAIITIWVLIRLVDVLAYFVESRANQDDIPVEEQVIPLLQKSLKIFIGVVGALLVIQHLGYPITSLLGGLGIGGLAVALAAQDTLSNIFGSIIVFTDKPFKVGDWITIGDVSGTVEQVGFRSTRIRTFPRTLVTLPNNKVANSQIENHTAMPIRRVRFELGVSYETTPDQMERLVKGIEDILTNHSGVDQKFFMVKFTDFSVHSLNVLVYYFTVTTVWSAHLQVRQEVNLMIMRLMDELGIKPAIPARALYFGTDERYGPYGPFPGEPTSRQQPSDISSPASQDDRPS